LLERIQRRYTKMINDINGKTYEDRLRCLRLWTLVERRNRQYLIEALVIFRFISFLFWIQIVKLLGLIHENWLRPDALGILPNILKQGH